MCVCVYRYESALKEAKRKGSVTEGQKEAGSGGGGCAIFYKCVCVCVCVCAHAYVVGRGEVRYIV